ncbi:uncharacterized protein LOC141907135 [Tubulanus polymorphus]|uniref:uncharacterized protein LOC141907135 n=1 Tax=Tubulanus polymorphus TaxID=672921 RepID=UPI003DA3A0C2
MRSLVLLSLMVCLMVAFYSVQEGEAHTVYRCRRYCIVRCIYDKETEKWRCYIICWYVCTRVPHLHRDARDVSAVSAADNSTQKEHEVSIPNNFDFFDIDEDEKISVEEFSAGMNLDDDDAKFLIHQADNNEDSFVDREEFKNAPWPFQEKNDVESCDCKKP